MFFTFLLLAKELCRKLRKMKIKIYVNKLVPCFYISKIKLNFCLYKYPFFSTTLDAFCGNWRISYNIKKHKDRSFSSSVGYRQSDFGTGYLNICKLYPSLRLHIVISVS